MAWSKFGGKAPKMCASPAQKGAGCVMLSITELTRIAMERSNSSRAAVTIMGTMAAKYGFYGEDGFEGSGESLMVVDKNEGWVFHVLSHPSGVGAIWAAQRVPDDHVAAVTNHYSIRNVDLTDSANFLGSDLAGTVRHIPALAKTCPSNSACDFTLTFSDGEYAHKYYSGRRMWRVYEMLAGPGGSTFPATYGRLKEDAPYPTTAPVDVAGNGHRVALEDVMAVHRDHYEGTPYALTAGLAAGPFGNPNRNAGGEGEDQVHGNWERAISLQRTSDSYVVQARSWLPDAVGGVMWHGPHCPHATAYTPFAAGMGSLPMSFGNGHQGQYNGASAFWKIRYVAQAMSLKFNYTRRDVSAAQERLLELGKATQAQQDAMWSQEADAQSNSSNSSGEAAQLLQHRRRHALTRSYERNAAKTVEVYERLFHDLLFKYADGWVNEPSLGQGVGYPATWLKAVDYPGGPPDIPPSNDHESQEEEEEEAAAAGAGAVGSAQQRRYCDRRTGACDTSTRPQQ